MGTQPAPYQHFRATADADVRAGVYRVVGTPDDSVTLLRVTDETGTRRYTGEVVQVSTETLSVAFEPAENPDAGFGVWDILDRVIMNVKAVYWFVR